MSPETQGFIAFCTLWASLGWLGMAVIGYYRWRYQYMPIRLGEILGWGILIGGFCGPCVWFFMVVIGLMHLNWDIPIIKARHMTDETRQRLYDFDGGAKIKP